MKHTYGKLFCLVRGEIFFLKKEIDRRRPGKPEFPGQQQCSSDKPRSGKSWSLVPELWKSMRTNSAHNGQGMDRGEKAGINFLSLKTTKASTLVKNVLAFVRKIVGTSGRTRTGTPAKATDFESLEVIGLSLVTL